MKHFVTPVSAGLLGMLTGVMLLPVPAATAQTTATALASAEAGDAKAVIKRMAAHYRGLESASVTYDVEIKADSPMGPQTFELPYDMAFARPNKLAVHGRSDLMKSGMVSDGSSLNVYVHPAGKYVERDAPKTMSEFIEVDEVMVITGPTSGTEMSIFTSLLSDDPVAALEATCGPATYVGREEVDGVAHDRLVLSKEQLDIHLFVPAEGDPWITRIEPDLMKFYRSIDPTAPEMKMVINFDAWKPESPADAFVFVAPEGLVKAETLFDGPGQQEFAATELEGEPAPDFEIETIDGETFTLAEHKGKVVVLDFWATWCKPCVKALPIIQKVTSGFADQGVVFVAVDLQEPNEKVEAFMTKNGHSFTVGMDRKGAVAKLFKVGPIPQTVLIGKDGTVERVHIGLLPNLEQQLTEELETLIRGKTLQAHGG